MLKAIITFIVFTISFSLSMNQINNMAFSVIEHQVVSYDGIGNFACSDGKQFKNANLSFTGFRNNPGQLYGSFEIYFKDAYNSTLAQGGVLDRGNIDPKGFSIEGLVMSDTLCNNTAPKPITIIGDCEKVSVANIKIQKDQAGSFTGKVICPIEKEQGAPVAQASGPSEVIGGQEVVLDASNSYDPDRDGLTFSWSQIGG
ncbi:MAG: PKD domain-containing protein, partial [Thermoproteota archaeon]|nr:PKD domain-containing protein [Thermoproteota archaeon]